MQRLPAEELGILCIRWKWGGGGGMSTGRGGNEYWRGVFMSAGGWGGLGILEGVW